MVENPAFPTDLAEAIKVIEELRQAVDSHQRIGVAVGILMERYGLDEEVAFSYLVRTSSLANVKLRVIAADIVAVTAEGNSRT